MSTQDTFPIVLAVARIASGVTAADVKELREYFSLRHAVGVIVDPTCYRDEMPTAEKCERIFRAFAPFHAAVLEVFAQEMAEIGLAPAVTADKPEGGDTCPKDDEAEA